MAVEKKTKAAKSAAAPEKKSLKASEKTPDLVTMSKELAALRQDFERMRSDVEELVEIRSNYILERTLAKELKQVREELEMEQDYRTYFEFRLRAELANGDKAKIYTFEEEIKDIDLEIERLTAESTRLETELAKAAFAIELLTSPPLKIKKRARKK